MGMLFRVSAPGVVCAALLVSASAGEPWTREWIDEIWQTHLLQRGEALAGSGALEEAYFRDALRADPKSAAAVELLVNYYGSTGEPMLAAGAALYGRLLAPENPLWADALERARDSMRGAPADPAGEADRAAYEAGLKSMLEQVQAGQLMLAEIEVRRLLTRFPRDPRLLENLVTFARLSGERAMQAIFALALEEAGGAKPEWASLLDPLLKELGVARPEEPQP